MNWEAVANCRTIYQPRGQAGEYSRLATNPWESYTHQVLDCVNRLGVKHYIKRDLQGYLPQEYPNERQIQQNFGA